MTKGELVKKLEDLDSSLDNMLSKFTTYVNNCRDEIEAIKDEFLSVNDDAEFSEPETDPEP